MEKKCEVCGETFKKRPRDSVSQWDDRAFCSLACSNKMKTTKAPHLYFWEKADRRQDDECWPWLGTVDQNGYGRVIFMTSAIKAHRVSYEMANGPIPDGLVIMHKCDNPNCVNPNHLEAGTQRENMIGASVRGRLNPISTLNLKPGQKGFYGGGPKLNKERKYVG